MINEKDFNNNKVTTIRNFLKSQEEVDFWYLANECNWSYGRVSNTFSKIRQKRMTYNFISENFIRTELWKRCCDLFKNFDRKLGLTNAYINYSDHATVNLPHCDGQNGGPSFLININQEWKRDWAGYTVLFKGMHDNEILHTVLPEPSKATIFKGTIWHTGTPVSHFAEYPRFMLTLHCHFLEKEINK